HLHDPKEKPNAKKEVLTAVAILDTAPSEKALDNAVPQFPNNNLLKNVASRLSGRIIHLTRQFSGLQPGDRDKVCGHRYQMTDHGLFVAGIINRLAPNAELHLIEVLDEYGVGTFSAIFAGLAKALELQPKYGHLLVNMSLTLSTPRQGHDTSDLP